MRSKLQHALAIARRGRHPSRVAAMKLAAAALFTLLAVPGLARAEPGIAYRDLPLSDGRAVTSVARFDLVGLHWRGTGDLSFRTRGDTGRWSA